MQGKLFVLVGCLFAVLWCMQQAAKPETWYWLVRLDEAAKASKAEEQVKAAALLPTAETNDAERTSGIGITIGTVQDRQHYDPKQPPQNLPWGLEAIYWKSALQRLSPEQRFVFVEMLHRWCSQLDAETNVDQVLASTIERLKNLRTNFDREVRMNAAAVVGQLNSEHLFQAGLDEGGADEEEAEELSSESEGSLAVAEADDLELGFGQEGIGERRPKLFELPSQIELLAAQQIGDQTQWLFSYWQVPEEGDLSRTALQAELGLKHWSEIRTRIVQPMLLALIADGSRMGRSEERAAWLSLIHSVAASETNKTIALKAEVKPGVESEPALVTQQNLLGQPDVFRGQQVRINGVIRRMERVRQSDPTVAQYLNDQDYVVLWVQPGVSGQGPYCVFCLPNSELLALAEENSELRRGVTITGYFFKLRSYTTAGGQSAWCPLLLAADVQLSSPTTVEPLAPPTLLQWLTYIGGVMLLASCLAAGGWYLTRYRSANPLGAKKRAASQVQWLRDENVKSISESLGSMEQQTSDQVHDFRVLASEPTESNKGSHDGN